MEVQMKVTEPDEVQVTLTITAPMKDWRQIAGMVKQTHATYPLLVAISEATINLRNRAIVSVETKEDGA